MNHPPELVQFDQYGDWSQYESRLYEIYLEIIVWADLRFLGHPVRVRFLPETRGMGYGFWHLISEAPDSRNRDEEARIPDLRRCERLPWVSWCITNAQNEGFSYWENYRKGQVHVVIWAKAYDFAVVLAKRQPQGQRRFYLLKTAYCLREHTKAKFRKERDAWRAAQSG